MFTQIYLSDSTLSGRFECASLIPVLGSLLVLFFFWLSVSGALSTGVIHESPSNDTHGVIVLL